MISIIVPVYNIENYLSRCLDSILGQTYSDFELILVDDGSTDSSGFICDQYAQSDKRITVIHQENKGLSPARNAGLERSRGDYILMIDGDDFIHSRMVEILYGLITSDDYDFAMCSNESVCENDKINVNRKIDFVSTTQVLSQDDCMRCLNCGDPFDFVVVWNKLYRRNMIEGVSFNHDAGQDFEYNTIVYQRVNKAIFLPERLYYYSERPGSFQHLKIGRRYFDTLITFEACLDEIPIEKELYRNYCLNNLYKRMLSRYYDAKGTQYNDYVRGMVSRIREKTIKELLCNHEMSLKNKYSFAFLTKPLEVYVLLREIIRYQGILRCRLQGLNIIVK